MNRLASGQRYAVISPLRDEGHYVEHTIRSVIQQTIPPVCWIIVDDGSRDDTATIIRRYLPDHPFLRLVQNARAGERRTGSAEIEAFNIGFKHLTVEYDFIVKLDGDLSFSPDYFEKLLMKFEDMPRLGIASGLYSEMHHANVWRPVQMPSYHAFGASKMVRRRCFEEIGGFLTEPGWDTVDEIRAWHYGWLTSHFRELMVRHHRHEGSAMGLLKTSRMHGEIYYRTGGDVLFLLLKAFNRIAVKPPLLGAAALICGYVVAALKKRPRLVSEAQARRYRTVLRRRLRWPGNRRTASSA